MPYKDKAVRNARARQKRAIHGDAIRKYHRLYQRKYRAKHLSKLRAYQREWASAQRRKIRGENFGKRKRKKSDREVRQTRLARKRRYHDRHREQINVGKRQKRMDNPEKFRGIDRLRYWLDPEKRRHQSRVARAKRTGQPCYISLEDWKAPLVRFDFRCAYCGTEITKSNRSLDHRVPLVRGGTNDISNLVPSCLRCNQQKHSMTAEEFLIYCEAKSL